LIHDLPHHLMAGNNGQTFQGKFPFHSVEIGVTNPAMTYLYEDLPRTGDRRRQFHGFQGRAGYRAGKLQEHGFHVADLFWGMLGGISGTRESVSPWIALVMLP